MVASPDMEHKSGDTGGEVGRVAERRADGDGLIQIVVVIGPTASGKSASAIELARERGGEVISMDSRQVYRTLDIGTEKIAPDEMQDVPHHLIDIREPEETYSAGDFAEDATRIIRELSTAGKTPIIAGGTHFYLDALLYGLPQQAPANPLLRRQFESRPAQELFAELQMKDPRRAGEIDPMNKRRLVRALELVEQFGAVPERPQMAGTGGLHSPPRYKVEWVIIDPPKDRLRERIDARLAQAVERGLIAETQQLRDRVGDQCLNEFGLEYRIVGEYLRGERDEATLFPALSQKLWQYARHQKAWLRKLTGSL